MIDLHSHIIPGIDDGARSVEDTYNMIIEAKEAGFTDIVATSHFFPNYFEPTTQELILWKNKLQELLNYKKIDIRLHSGMEVYICNGIEDFISNQQLLALGDSRYMLMEMPMNTPINFLDHIVYFLKSMNIRLIIAHPERYSYVQNNFEIINDYLDNDILLQCNYASILGFYGKGAEQTMKKMLKQHKVHFLGSDCHRPNSVYALIPEAVDKIKRLIGEDEFYDISTKNPKKVLNNEKVE